jgi:hypothetical protein
VTESLEQPIAKNLRFAFFVTFEAAAVLYERFDLIPGFGQTPPLESRKFHCREVTSQSCRQMRNARPRSLENRHYAHQESWAVVCALYRPSNTGRLTSAGSKSEITEEKRAQSVTVGKYTKPA